jgi:hypothetical protein
MKHVLPGLLLAFSFSYNTTLFAQRITLDAFAGKSYPGKKNAPGLDALNTFGARIRYMPDSLLSLGIIYQFSASYYHPFRVKYDELIFNGQYRYSEIGITSSISRHLIGVCYSNELKKPRKVAYPFYTFMVGSAFLRTYSYLERVVAYDDSPMFGIQSGSSEDRVQSNVLYTRAVPLYSLGTGLRVYPLRMFKKEETESKWLSQLSVVCAAAYTGCWDVIRFDPSEGTYSVGNTPSDASYQLIGEQYKNKPKSVGKINLLELSLGAGFCF